jgi:hypothetical protein
MKTPRYVFDSRLVELLRGWAVHPIGEDEIIDLVLDEAMKLMKLMNGTEKQARSRLRSLISVALGKGT